MEMQQGTTAQSNLELHVDKSGIRPGPSSGSSIFHFDHQNDSEEMRLLQLAGNLLARSREMQSRITTIEAASKACKCARIVSDAIVDILENAKSLLIKMSEIADPAGRVILAESYGNILNQIDSIVKDGYYNNKNLAKEEKIVVPIDDSGRPGFSITGIDMSCAGLELQPFTGDLITNADIVGRLANVELAANTLTAHCFGFDTIAFLLESRMKFARGMIDILEEGNLEISNSRAGHEAVSQVLSEIIWTASNENDDVVDPKYARNATENMSPRK